MSMKQATCKLLLGVLMLGSIRMDVFDKNFEDKLNAFVEKTLQCRHVPGLTISVVKGDETWTRGYGTADFSTSRPVTKSTLFNIGSVTKSFTMVLLGALLSEKSLDWNTKVHDILGHDYGFIGEWRNQEMTLSDMLSHRTGLARLDIGLLAGYPHTLSREQFCKNLKYLPEKKPFRDGFLYNNFMYGLLGHIAEKLGEDTWENLVTTKVINKIGMTSTRILQKPEDVLQDDVAKPYIFKDDAFHNGTLEIYSLYPIEPAGAILSTGEDMAKYIQFYLKGGYKEDGTQLLDLELLLDAFTAITPTVDKEFLERNFLTLPEFPVSDTQIGYGYGWFTSTYRGYRRIWHSGGLFSYITLVWIFPDINAGIFASVNGPGLNLLPGNALKTIFYYISDTLINKEAWLNETTTCEYPEYWQHNKTTNSTPLEPPGHMNDPSEYAGYFRNNYLPGINISEITGNNSILSFQVQRLGGILHSTEDKDRFKMEVTSPWEYMISFTDDNNNPILVNSTFLLDEKGQVKSLEVEFEVKVLYTKEGYQDRTSASARISFTDGFFLLSFILVCDKWVSVIF